MHSKELIKELAKRSGLPQQDVKTVMRLLKEVIISETNKGNTIVYKGFFKAYPYTIKEREVYNITTKQINKVDARPLIKIKASKTLKPTK